MVGLREGKEALAIPARALKDNPLYQTTVGGEPLLVVFEPASGTARVFTRRVEGRTLTFESVRRGPHLLLRDRETSTVWSPLAGKALEGALAGRELTPVQHTVSYWFVWSAYHPHHQSRALTGCPLPAARCTKPACPVGAERRPCRRP
ncbi:MAG: DUF3179 domain-containing protein, partial [Acidobacteria bacterium]|nr:DUF3179 domain-containing protein [Acidobacteriota bacterium]